MDEEKFLACGLCRLFGPLLLYFRTLQPKISKPASRPTSHPAERWEVLPLDPQSMHPQQPQVGEKDSSAHIYPRASSCGSGDYQDPIDLYVIRPNNVPKPPVVLYLYSFPTESDRFRDDLLCENLTRNGLAAVGFVSALTGQRYHDRPMKEWFVSELPEALGTSVHDVQMVLNYLETRGDLDMSRVGIFGQGSGGTIAILSAGVDSRIKAVDALDPWGDWPVWLAQSPRVPESERPKYLTSEFLYQSCARRPSQMAAATQEQIAAGGRNTLHSHSSRRGSKGAL